MQCKYNFAKPNDHDFLLNVNSLRTSFWFYVTSRKPENDVSINMTLNNYYAIIGLKTCFVDIQYYFWQDSIE